MNEIKDISVLDTTLTSTPEKKKRAPRSKPMEALKATPVEVPTPAPYIDPRENAKRELAAKIAAERAYKSQMVTGKFLFNECPGGELKFCYREFPGDQLINYTMKHDSIQTIPLGVAIHLNDRCSYYEYQHNLDNGKAVDVKDMYIQSKVHRTNFIPLNFTLDAGNYSGQSIAQVTHTNPLDTRFSLDSLGR